MPAEHVPSCRQVDEDVWTELRNFKKCLLQMFMAKARPEPAAHPSTLLFYQGTVRSYGSSDSLPLCQLAGTKRT